MIIIVVVISSSIMMVATATSAVDCCGLCGAMRARTISRAAAAAMPAATARCALACATVVTNDADTLATAGGSRQGGRHRRQALSVSRE
jgi:hypothetical protein